MTHDLVWAERVKSEYKDLLKKVTRLDMFLDSNPGRLINDEDLLLLKAQRNAMASYAIILLTRLHHHNLDVTDEELYNEQS